MAFICIDGTTECIKLHKGGANNHVHKILLSINQHFMHLSLFIDMSPHKEIMLNFYIMLKTIFKVFQFGSQHFFCFKEVKWIQQR